MNDFWNNRYAEKSYAYGIEPNVFYKEQLLKLPKGKILFVAGGEGRNAVYAAQQGFDVVAFDQSIEGKYKADFLAQERKLSLNYQICGLEEVSFQKDSFDILVFVFTHFPFAIREQYFPILTSFLKTGGHIIFESFGKEQIHLNSGGPKQLEMLYSEEEVTHQFPNIQFVSLTTVETILDEGPFHQGKANVVRFLGKKI